MRKLCRDHFNLHGINNGGERKFLGHYSKLMVVAYPCWLATTLIQLAIVKVIKQALNYHKYLIANFT